MAVVGKSFHFMEAKPLLEFLEKYEDRIIGRKLTAVRSNITPSPISTFLRYYPDCLIRVCPL